MFLPKGNVKKGGIVYMRHEVSEAQYMSKPYMYGRCNCLIEKMCGTIGSYVDAIIRAYESSNPTLGN